MSTGTLPGNLELIRNNAYGTTVREAIASAIEQADTYSDGKIAQIRQEVQNEIRMSTSQISGTTEDYLLTIVNPN